MKIRYGILATALFLVHAPLSAQVSVAARLGTAEGTANYGVAELRARVPAIGPLHATAAIEIIGGSWACAETPTSALTCGYDGRTVSVGPSLVLVDTGRFYLAPRASLGWFERTGTYGGREYTGSDHTTVAVGMDAELGLIGRLGFQAGVTHRRILDAAYDDVTGETPRFTALLVGLSFELGGSD